jgi:hypothetical protein
LRHCLGLGQGRGRKDQQDCQEERTADSTHEILLGTPK